MIKTLNKLGMAGNFLNVMIANIMLNYEQQCFVSMIQNKTKMSTFTILFIIVLETLASTIRPEKEMKRKACRLKKKKKM